MDKTELEKATKADLQTAVLYLAGMASAQWPKAQTEEKASELITWALTKANESRLRARR